MAGIKTVASDRFVHSLHGYFLRPGDPSVPAIIRVERTRDGGSFSARRILVTQRGEAIFNMDASFQVPESGLSHQIAMPDLQPPLEAKIPKALFDAPFVTWRHEFRRLQSETPQPPEQFVWFKSTGPVPEDPALAACLLVYESDNVLLGTARLPHRGQLQARGNAGGKPRPRHVVSSASRCESMAALCHRHPQHVGSQRIYPREYFH